VITKSTKWFRFLLVSVFCAVTTFAQTSFTGTQSYETANFIIHYETSGVHATISDDADNNGIPDYVEMAGRSAEHAWRVLIDSSGYQPPQTSKPQLSGKYLIQIVDIEQFSTMPNASEIMGYTIQSVDRKSSIVIENDMVAGIKQDTMHFEHIENDELLSDNANRFPESLVWTTIHHEFYHAVQHRYPNGLEKGPFIESTASWFENFSAPAGCGINHIDYFVPYMANGFLGMANSSNQPYGNYLYLSYLQRVWGKDRLRHLLEYHDAHPLPSTASESDYISFWCQFLQNENIPLDSFMSGYSLQMLKMIYGKGSIFPNEEVYFKTYNSPKSFPMASYPGLPDTRTVHAFGGLITSYSKQQYPLTTVFSLTSENGPAYNTLIHLPSGKISQVGITGLSNPVQFQFEPGDSILVLYTFAGSKSTPITLSADYETQPGLIRVWPAEVQVSDAFPFGIEAIYDNDPATGWPSSVDTAWIAYDFRIKAEVSSVTLIWPPKVTHEYAIEYSDNGTVWITAETETIRNNNKDSLLLTKKPLTRFIRLRCIKPGYNHFRVNEFWCYSQSSSLQPNAQVIYPRKPRPAVTLATPASLHNDIFDLFGRRCPVLHKQPVKNGSLASGMYIDNWNKHTTVTHINIK